MTAPQIDAAHPLSDTDDELREDTRTALDAVGEVLDTYVAFPSPEARDAVVLWIAHAHVYDSFESTPRLSVVSTEPGSGKSRVLELIEHMTPKPLYALNITPGVLWHEIENVSPTVLLDEVDTIFGKEGSGSAHTTLRSILNGGYRKGATVPRLHGRGGDVKRYQIFCPVAMAGIGRLPDTIRTRSVEIPMRKRREDQEVRPFRLKFAQDAMHHARVLLEDWALDAGDMLELAMPDLPVSDRDADVWEPLIAISELAGPDWVERAHRACQVLTEARDGGAKAKKTPGMRLLSDLAEVFDAPSVATATLLSRLRERGWKLEPKPLAHMLREYGVSPCTVVVDDARAKGYKRSDLEEVWAKYKIA